MTDWHRPHPLTVVVMAVTFITGNIVPLLVLVIAGGGLGIEMMGAVLGFVTVGAGGLRWYLTSYAVTPQAVEFRTGVLNRQARSIPLDRASTNVPSPTPRRSLLPPMFDSAMSRSPSRSTSAMPMPIVFM